jgi:hypothetical protein
LLDELTGGPPLSLTKHMSVFSVSLLSSSFVSTAPMPSSIADIIAQ